MFLSQFPTSHSQGSRLHHQLGISRQRNCRGTERGITQKGHEAQRGRGGGKSVHPLPLGVVKERTPTKGVGGGVVDPVRRIHDRETSRQALLHEVFGHLGFRTDPIGHREGRSWINVGGKTPNGLSCR